MWFFYTPIVFYIVALTIKYRGLSFLGVNPGFHYSGIVGDDKSLALAQLQARQAEFTAKFILIPFNLTHAEKLAQAQSFMADNDYSFPIILKPNFGQRGQGVAVIKNAIAMAEYLQDAEEDIVVQEFIAGLEFGVFYYRAAGAEQGEIFSITEKQFPILLGDGVSNIEQLILNNPRTHFMAKYLLDLHQTRLAEVLAVGTEFQTVEIGSHCRGSLFLDANTLNSDAMLQRFDQLSSAVDGFFFGRYDIRVPSADDFRAGQNFKVLELNGVTSEATHIYDPQHSAWYAYKTLFQQWRIAYRIGADNINKGLANKTSLLELFQHLKACL